jgi:hypothetical protein
LKPIFTAHWLLAERQVAHLGVAGIFLLGILFVLITALQKGFQQSTGVTMPSNKTLRGVRQCGRKKGLTEMQAYEQYIARQQKKAKKSRSGSAGLTAMSCQSGTVGC